MVLSSQVCGVVWCGVELSIPLLLNLIENITDVAIVSIEFYYLKMIS